MAPGWLSDAFRVAGEALGFLALLAALYAILVLMVIGYG